MDKKSIPALKIKIFLDMADSIPFLVPILNARNGFFSIKRPKIPALSTEVHTVEYTARSKQGKIFAKKKARKKVKEQRKNNFFILVVEKFP